MFHSTKKRLVDNGTVCATAYPSMHALAGGTNKDRVLAIGTFPYMLRLLGLWDFPARIVPNCSKDGCSRERTYQHVSTRLSHLGGPTSRAKRTLTLVSVKDMSKPPHNFSEHLGLQLVCTIWQDTVYCILCAVCTYTQSGRRLPTSLPTSKESKLLSCRLIS